MDCDSLISEFDALPRDEVLELLVQCISQLSPTQKTILALYYHEDLEPAEIAACVGLTEGEVDQVCAETVGLLRTMLAAQIGLPASFDKPDADGVGLLVDR
jgi:DNA-directed RNA polymerase specialized sigma24 family protein